MTFWEKSKRLPPILVRLLAKDRYGIVFHNEEIATRSGLHIRTVSILSHLTDWDGVDMPTMHAFQRGCLLDFEDRKQLNRALCYLNSNPKWKHLRRDHGWQSYYRPLLKKLQDHARRTTTSHQA